MATCCVKFCWSHKYVRNFNLHCVYMFMHMSVWHHTHVYLYISGKILTITCFELEYWIVCGMFIHVCHFSSNLSVLTYFDFEKCMGCFVP